MGNRERRIEIGCGIGYLLFARLAAKRVACTGLHVCWEVYILPPLNPPFPPFPELQVEPRKQAKGDEIYIFAHPDHRE